MYKHPLCFDSKENLGLKEDYEYGPKFENEWQQSVTEYPPVPSPNSDQPSITSNNQPQYKHHQQFLGETSSSQTLPPYQSQPNQSQISQSTIKSLRSQKKSKLVRLEPNMTHQKYARRMRQISLADLKNELKYFLDMKQFQWSRKEYQRSQVNYHQIAEKEFISRIHRKLGTDIVHEELPEIDYHFTRANQLQSEDQPRKPTHFKKILSECFELVWNSFKTTGKSGQQVLIITGWGKGSKGDPKLFTILKNYCVAMKQKKLLTFTQAEDKGSILVTFFKR